MQLPQKHLASARPRRLDFLELRGVEKQHAARVVGGETSPVIGALHRRERVRPLA